MKNNKWIKNGLTLFFLAVMLYAGSQLVLILRDYAQGSAVYQEAQTEYVEPPTMEEEMEFAEPDVQKPNFQVNFAELEAVNSDVCGWIYMNDTVINYPVVRGTNSNDTYLKKTYDGKANSAGSIFMDYRNAKDYSDDNTVIYGHNMKNGKMFAALKRFSGQNYADAHNVFYIMTAEGNRRYEVVSAFQTDALSNIYTRTFGETKKKQEWLQQIVRSSAVQTTVPVNENDSFVTLSTCVSGNDTRARFVVIGVLTAIEPID